MFAGWLSSQIWFLQNVKSEFEILRRQISQIFTQKLKNAAQNARQFFANGGQITSVVEPKMLLACALCALTDALLQDTRLALFFLRSFLWNFALFFTLFYPLALLSNRLLNAARNTLFCFVVAVSVVNLFLIPTFGTSLNAVTMQIFLATNTQEAVEFLQSYVSLKAALLVAVAAAASIFAWQTRFNRVLSKRLGGVVFIISCVIVLQNFAKTNLARALKHTPPLYAIHSVATELSHAQNTANLQAALDAKLESKLRERPCLKTMQARPKSSSSSAKARNERV